MSTEWTDGPDGEGLDDLEFDEELEAQFDAEWEQAERDAVGVLRQALADRVGAPPPAELASAAASARTELAADRYPWDWIGRGAGFGLEPPPDDDAELLIRCAAATISPVEETGLAIEDEATLISLEHPDWLGAIVTTIRGGFGADASPSALVDGVRECPEVVLDAELDIDDASYLETAFWIISMPWHALGITDRDQRLTALGEWLLPRALARAWSGDFDQEPQDEA